MRPLFALMSLLALYPCSLFAQTTPDAPTSDPATPTTPVKRRSATAPPAKKKSGSAKTATLKEGTLVSLDLPHESVTLKEGKTDKKYTLTEKTHFLRGHFEAQPEEFKPGEKVVFKLRKVRGKEAYTVFEFADADTYAWLTGLRKSPSTGKIKEISDETLVLTVLKEEITYLISPKTEWEKNGKVAASTDFKEGDTVTVSPRSLPSGTIMAKIVADQLKVVDKKTKAVSAKRTTSTKRATSRKGISIRGMLQSLDRDQHCFTLHMEGETRLIYYVAATEIRVRTRAATFAALLNGQTVSVRLSTFPEEPNLATRITIESTVRRSKSPFGKKPTLPRTYGSVLIVPSVK